MPKLGFYPMIERYARWQLEYLGVDDGSVFDTLYHGFAGPASALLRHHRNLLGLLHCSGLQLGIVSNFCGNIQTICDEFGYSDYLQVAIDSRHAGVAKPDPAIFQLALHELGVPAETTIYVGDSFERDVLAAKAAGLGAIWVSPGTDAPNADAIEPDGIVSTLDELPSALGVSVAEGLALQKRGSR
jgi:HAD superfamily hydrolase (TIGR01509 family)